MLLAKNAVHAPTNVIINNAVELYSNNGEDLTNKYKPAVTRVLLHELKLILV